MQKRVSKDGSKKVAAFFKRNIYYVLMIICVIAIGTMITVAAVVNKDNGGGTDVVVPPVENPGETPIDKPTEFILVSPVGNFDIIKNIALGEIILDATTGNWTGHAGVDFAAAAGTDVKSPFAGTVTSVTSDGMWGSVVTIDHGNGYKSVLKLLKDVSVAQGKVLAQGDVIGKITDTAMKEVADGAHLHYELLLNSVNVDPMQYMPNGDK